jgi:hypothetical protein
MRRGDIVTIPKSPERNSCVVIDVAYSDRGEAMVLLGEQRKGDTFWTRASNCEKILDNG